jgi:hypothetical protein
MNDTVKLSLYAATACGAEIAAQKPAGDSDAALAMHAPKGKSTSKNK